MGLWPIVKGKRLLNGLAVALVIGLLICLAAGLDFSRRFPTVLSDQLFKAAALQTPAGAADDTVIVTVGERSLAALDLFNNWPRSRLDALVGGLNAVVPRLTVFDVLFSEPPPDDAAFTITMANAGNVVPPHVSRLTCASTAAGRSLRLQDRIEPDLTVKDPALARSGRGSQIPGASADDGWADHWPVAVFEGMETAWM